LHLLIPAAGSGRRMGAGKNKLLLPLLGRPIIYWTLQAALNSYSIDWIGIISQRNDRKELMKAISSNIKLIKWIEGGETRQESVKNGIDALPPEASHVLIHDGARCLIDPDLFDLCSEELLKGNSVVAANPVVDTIKVVDSKKVIIDTPNRSSLWAAQTPQGFRVDKLKKAHEIAKINKWEVTDDASLFERLNWEVKILESDSTNLKVTNPIDLKFAEVILKLRF
tara:strand:- start:443 stop:1117 length:675 start_codon:yes stop_codon:yes gene_type:complete